MPSVLNSIRLFLHSKRDTHNDPSLIDRVLLRDVELQCNMIPGTPVKGHKGVFTDGKYKFWNLRIPKGANREPWFDDYELPFPLEEYCESIGSTGWDWIDRCSRWVCFDLDSIANHKAGLDADALEAARQRACELPYVECRRSTSGKGFHLIVELDEIPCQNHTRHAAIAQQVLRKMSHDTQFDFAATADIVGGNFWIWSKRATSENGGLSLVKESTC
jgi:hypothetical protein